MQYFKKVTCLRAKQFSNKNTHRTKEATNRRGIEISAPATPLLAQVLECGLREAEEGATRPVGLQFSAEKSQAWGPGSSMKSAYSP